MVVELSKNPFGSTAAGEAVTEYVLNSGSIEVSVIDYGAIITSIKTRDKSGAFDDIVTGFTSVAGMSSLNRPKLSKLTIKAIQRHFCSGYEKYPKYFGATVGRCCNRIGKGKFVLNGTSYSLPINNGPNSLHGGIIGFDKVRFIQNSELI